MGTGPYQPPAGEPPPDAAAADPDALPATRGDIRDLRRWLIVAGVWAVAASAIALVALLSDDKASQSDRRSGDDSAAIARVQRTLDKRIDDLDSKVDDLPSSDDVSKLQSSLSDVEKQASAAASDAGAARDAVSDLESRVEDLENAQPQGSGGTTTPEQP
jgi:hypothetical protein